MRFVLLVALLLSVFAYGQRDHVVAGWEKDNDIESILTNWYEGLASYGEIHDPADTIVTATTGYYTLTDWTAGTSKNVTVDTTGYLIIQKAGMYRIGFTMSFTHSVNNTLCHISAFDGTDTELTNIETERKIGTGGDFGNVGAVGLASFSVGDTLMIRGKADKSGNFIINHGNVTIIRLR